MKRSRFIITVIALLIGALTLIGCAGDLGPPTGLLSAAVTFRITWSANPSPDKAQSANLALTASNGTKFSTIAKRNPSGPQTQDYVISPSVPVGPATFTADFISGNNIKLGSVSGQKQIVPSKNPNDNTIIISGDVTGPLKSVAIIAGQTVKLSETRALLISVQDADGNYVAVLTKNLHFQLADTASAEFLSVTPDGEQVTGLKVGTGRVTVTASPQNSTPTTSAPAAVQVVAGVFISPVSAVIAPLGQQVFTASQPVVWSVQEGTAGGAIVANSDGSATYTAPVTPGTFHVVAASQSDSSQFATASVTVQSGSGGFRIQ